jgi:DNA segregation ATPase FtsK/SpoIIIE, S-DNA-T family
VPFLRRKRRSSSYSSGYSSSRRRKKPPTLRDQMDWTLRPDTAREIIGLFFIVLGGLFIISLFGFAGNVGKSMVDASVWLFGLLGFVAPLVLLVIGIKLIMPRQEDEYIKATTGIGIFLAFIFFPSLFGSLGGTLGKTIFTLAASQLGSFGGYLALLGISIAALLMATNISLGYLLARIKIERESSSNVNVHGAKAKVFTFSSRNKATVVETPTAPVRALTSKEGEWEFPPLDLLSLSDSLPDAGNINKNRDTIQKTLKDFTVDVTMSDVNVGPTVSQYTLKPADGVKLTNITSRSNDLALSLAAPSVRIEAPIPGKSLVGVEIPNKSAATVTLREILESEDLKKTGSNLSLALGRDAAGAPFVVDLTRMPHMLIAGSTGSGKSVCINAILVNLLYLNSPSDLRLLLVDPKRVEFTEYNGIPHLLAPVVTEVDKTVSMLKWTVAEMERRFKLFAESSARNISVYNENPTEGKLPYIVVVIDELADLMTQAANEVETSIVRIAQMARAVGIHLIVATQRPSVDVITGIIKANIPTRIAFAVASNADSRTILDQGGAEKLLGRGDMLYLSTEVPQPKRAQSVFVTDKEIRSVTDFLKREGDAEYDESITSFKATGSRGASARNDNEVDDDLFEEAKTTVIQTGKASASLLQRRLRVGYARAARLLDLLEQEGIIGPPDGAKPRDILVSDESPYSNQDTL